MNLGKKIIKIRKDAKMSQEDFSEVLNVTRQTVSNWENSKNYPDIETLIKISDVFHVSLDILLKSDKEMVKDIDKKVRNNQKLKRILTILIVLCTFLLLIFLLHRYFIYKQRKEDEIRYQEIMDNVKILGFGERDGIGFSSIIENGVTYKIYVKKPEVLEPHISATTKWKEDEAILMDYNGKKVAVTYVNENNTTVYCDKKGNLLNKKQKEENTEIYKKYQERTIKIVTRMVELFENIYE